MDDTLLQFGRALGSGPRASSGAHEPRGATVCPKCAQHFSPDGRFCPFDGEPLRAAPEWDPSSDPLLGTVVDGRYEIRSVLGEGGMGVVYEARHCALGKRFALKALRKDLSKDADIAARFMQEARTAAAVSHPGLVEITDFGQLPAGQPFFVMELLEGQSLATLIRRGGPIPAARAVAIVRQIAEALGAAHDHSIVHRDLKPDNIHISSAGPGHDRVTIVDFGLAKVVGTSRLTRAGMVFGTPHYMSPEQAMGEATDHRTDVYALGIVMYEMFTGRVPFEADSYMGVLTKHMYMAPTPPSQLLATAELGVLEDITLRCLEKKPDHRYATLGELTHDLDLALNAPNGERPSVSRQRRAIPRSLLADELELPGREELPLWSKRATRKRQLRWPLIVVGALFLAGIAGMLALRKVSSVSFGRSGDEARVGDLTTRVPAGSAAVAAVTAPLPIMSSRAAPALPATTQASPAAVSHSQTAPTPKRVKPSVALAAPPAVPRAASPAAPKKPARSDSSDIVDPWAK
ncbi:MAG: serine/threonine-protein kinase [Myxococcales bacterium]